MGGIAESRRQTGLKKNPARHPPVLWSYIYQKLKILYDVFREIVVSIPFFCRMKTAMRIFYRIETNILGCSANRTVAQRVKRAISETGAMPAAEMLGETKERLAGRRNATLNRLLWL